MFESTMGTALDLIFNPPSILHGPFLCMDDCHKLVIEEYFLDIENAIRLADSVLERTNSNALKPFWFSHLTQLKRESFNSHRSWLAANKPESGSIYDKQRGRTIVTAYAKRKRGIAKRQKMNYLLV